MFQNSKEYLDAIVQRYLTLIHVKQADNWDYEVLGHTGNDTSQVFDLERHKEFTKYFFPQSHNFFYARKLLADETSRQLFDELVLYRLLGHLHVKLSTNNPVIRRSGELMRQQAVSLSPLKIRYSFGEPQHYAIPFEGDVILYDGWWYAPCLVFYRQQYYFNRNNIIISPTRGDRVLDIGAFFGETALAFAHSVGAEGKVYAFDFCEPNITAIKYNLGQNQELQARIKLFEIAVSDQTRNTTQQKFNYADHAFAGAAINREYGTEAISTTTIDAMVEEGRIDRVDFIKMDIEGEELNALKGAMNTIKKFRPKLAISVYHKDDDMVKIPVYLKELIPEYELHLDHYTIVHEETVLYAHVRDN